MKKYRYKNVSKMALAFPGAGIVEPGAEFSTEKPIENINAQPLNEGGITKQAVDKSTKHTKE